MAKFTKKVDMRSRKEMTEYLKGHFRYPTANRWNRSTSYACNMKIYSLDLPADIKEKLWNFLDCDELYEEINYAIAFFDEAHDYRWQAGFNGRSGGYLVLYQGGKEPSGYKSFCPRCGQQNYTSVKETGDVCGRCQQHSRIDYDYIPMQTFAYPGKATDMDEDFDEWDMADLRNRVKLVQEFDELANEIVEIARYYAENYTVCEESICVEEKVKVLKEAQV